MIHEKIGVLGGGTMGRGIATVCALNERRVLILEVNEDSMTRSRERLQHDLEDQVQHWSLTPAEVKIALNRINYTIDPGKMADRNLLLESIPDVFDQKRKLLAIMDSICQPQTVFASTTASLSITELASATRRQKQFVGVHFLQPVQKIKVVEVVRGMDTSDDTFSSMQRFVRNLDKLPIEVFEFPGHITTRGIVPFLNEAIELAMEAVASREDINLALKHGFGLGVGPLELADHIGLDVVFQWMENLFREYGNERFRPNALLRKLVRSGRLGVKSGEGFFRYDDKGDRVREASEENGGLR